MSTVTITYTTPITFTTGSEHSFTVSVPLHCYSSAVWYVGSYTSPSDTDIQVEPLQGYNAAFGAYLDLTGTAVVSGHNVYTETDTSDGIGYFNLAAGSTITWWLTSLNSFTVDFIQIVLTYATDTIAPGIACHAATDNSLLAVSWTNDQNNLCLAIHPAPTSYIGSGSYGWRPKTMGRNTNPGSASMNASTNYAGASGPYGAIVYEHLTDSNSTTIKAIEVFQSERDYNRVYWAYDGSLWWGATSFAPDINSLPSGPLTYTVVGSTISVSGLLPDPTIAGQTRPPAITPQNYSGHNHENGWYVSRIDKFSTGLFPSDGGLLSDYILSTRMNTGQGVSYDSTPWGSGTFSLAAQMDTLPLPSLYFGSIQFNSTAGLLFSRRDGSIYWKTRDIVGTLDTWMDTTTANLQSPGTATSLEGLVVGLTYLTGNTLVALIWNWTGLGGDKTIHSATSNNGGTSWVDHGSIGLTTEVPPYLVSIDNIPMAVYIDTVTKLPTFLASEDGGITWL